MKPGEVSRIGWRSAPFAIFGVALLILLGGIGVIVQNEGNYDRARVEQTQGLADVLAASAAAAVDFDDRAAAQQAVDAFRVNRQIRLIGVYGRDGRAVAGYSRKGSLAAPTVGDMPPTPPNVIRVQSTIVAAGQRIGTVILDIEREAASRRAARYLILVGLFVLAALVVAALGFAQGQLRRANRELANRAEALAQANVLLEEQVEERAKAEDQLRQSQKMQALGQLTGGIAHDFNNQLTVIQGSADMLARPELPDTKRIRFAQAIVQAATNAASLTSQLLAFARRQPLKPERLDLNPLIESTKELLDRTMGERVRVVTELYPLPCRVEVDRAQLQSAILNIATNARDAMPPGDGGTLTIRTREVAGNQGKRMIAVEIEDTGEGMSADVQEHIFEPFFTTKGMGKGTGLGLSQVYGFAAQSGGEVRVASELGKGTVMTLLLPCVDDAPSETAAPLEPAALPPAAILVVEDNEDVGAFAEALLTELGHRVTRASSGEEALELARRTRFDIVLSDVVMPGMGGLRLADMLAAEQPDLPLVLATGYSQELVDGGSGGRPVILKPYRLATLAGALSSALREKRTGA